MSVRLLTVVLLPVVAIVLAALLRLPAPAAGADAGVDHMSYLDNGSIRLGVDLDLGGAITWLSRSNSNVNVVNSHDWGRQIQMSHYSGPVPFAPPGKQLNKHWAGLGWNPIQSGDCYGNRSKVIEHRNDGKEIYVKCIPMQWPLNDVPGECTFECWITLEGKTAHVRSRLNNDRSDNTQYGARGQELPAIYTNGPWYRLITYEGDKPFTGDATTTIPPQFPWAGWSATENWAALVNNDNWGLGIWELGTYSFIGGFAGKPGAGGPKDPPTGYIAPVRTEILDSNIQYEYSYVLILDSLEGIRQYVYDHAAKPAPPDYRFDKDRQHWRTVNAGDTGWPMHGEWKVLLEKNDPQLIGPPGFWFAKDAPKLYVEAAYHADLPVRSKHLSAEVFWARRDAHGFSAAQSMTFAVTPDGQYHTYEVNLGASQEYHGVITSLRFDPVPNGSAGETVRIRSISFRKPKAP